MSETKSKVLAEASTNGIPPPRPCVLCKFRDCIVDTHVYYLNKLV